MKKILNDNQKTEYTLSRREIFWLVFGAILFHWGLNYLDQFFGLIAVFTGIIFPFLLGGGIAFLLNLPMRFLERWLHIGLEKLHLTSKRLQKAVRPVSILLTLAIVGSVISGIAAVVVPQVSATVQTVGRECNTFLSGLQQEGGGEEWPLFQWIEEFGLDVAEFSSALSQAFLEARSFLQAKTLPLVTSVFDKAVSFGIAFVFAIYLLSGKERILYHTKRILRAFCSQRALKKIGEVFHLVEDTFSNFFLGQCLEACILGLMFFVGMSILQFPHTALISVLVSVTALIPVFGAFIACVVGAFLMLVEDPMQAVWFVIFFLVMQQIEGNLIYPHVMGSRVGLPSICVLVAVTLGGTMFGILGMLLFIPIFSILYALFQQWIERKLERKEKESISPTSS